MATDRLIDSYTQPRQMATHTPARGAGSSTKTHDTSMVVRDGAFIRVIPSASSRYLLPELHGPDFSLFERGTTRSHRPSLAFHNGLLFVHSTGHEADIQRWAAWLSESGSVLVFPPTESAVHEAAPGASMTPPPTADLSAPETAIAESTVALDSSTAAIASRIYELSGLDDEQLAALFKVQRETFNRWRTGVLTNPRAGSRRRLALLRRLFEDLAARGAPVRDWLLNTIDDESRTPYDLLARGRIDTVAYLAAAVGTAATQARELDSGEDELVFGEDDVWEPADPDDDA